MISEAKMDSAWRNQIIIYSREYCEIYNPSSLSDLDSTYKFLINSGLLDRGNVQLRGYDRVQQMGVTCPPKTGPGRVLGLDLIGGTENGKTERLHCRTDHLEIA